jgi:hypothetical protein
VFEQRSIRVLEDDDEAVGFEESDLPILHRGNGWTLRYLDGEGREREHLVTGEIDDVDLVVEQARAYLDRSPRGTAWPHS